MDILSTSSINNLINTSKQSEYSKRISPLLEKKNKFSQLSTTWSNLKSRLSSFKTLLSNLKDTESGGTFTAKTTELSNEDYFTVTANSSASLSSYEIRVEQLAKYDRVMSNTVNSDDTASVPAGNHIIQVASGEYNDSIEIETSGTETNEELMQIIADAINDALGEAVSASVFSPTSGESKLSVVSKDTGETNAITIQDVSGSLLDSIGINFTTRSIISDDTSGGYSSSLSELNAVLEFNGITVERSSNTIDDLINDVTLSLKSAMEVGIPTVNVIVKNNVEAFKTDIQDFITKFNESYQFVKNNYYSYEDGSRGVFVGNATALGMLQSFTNISYQQVEGISEGDYNSLADIGIEFDPASGLSISDSSLLDESLESNPDQVSTLFNADNGVATKLYDLVDSYIQTDGVISNLIDSYDSSISYLADKISYKEDQIDKNAQILRSKYEQMQLQLSSLYEMQNYFSMAGIL